MSDVYIEETVVGGKCVALQAFHLHHSNESDQSPKKNLENGKTM